MTNQRFTIRFLLLITTITACILVFTTIQPWKDPRFRPAATRKYDYYCGLLEAELTSDSPSADIGTYASFSENNTMRWIAFGTRHWVYEYRKLQHCGPDVYDRTFGVLHRTNAMLTLSQRYQSDSLPNSLQVFSWGERRYLLSPSEYNEFRRAVETGAEPRITIEGRFLLRMGDEKKSVSACPDLPV